MKLLNNNQKISKNPHDLELGRVLRTPKASIILKIKTGASLEF